MTGSTLDEKLNWIAKEIFAMSVRSPKELHEYYRIFVAKPESESEPNAKPKPVENKRRGLFLKDES